MAKTQTQQPDNKTGDAPSDKPQVIQQEADTATVEQLLADLERRSAELDHREARLKCGEDELRQREAAIASQSRRETKIDRKEAHPLLEHLAKTGTGVPKLKLIAQHIKQGGSLESLFKKLPSVTVEKITEFLQA